MITLADQLAIAVEDKAEQAGDAAVLLKYLLNSAKELSGALKISPPAAAQVVRGGRAVSGRNL